MKSLLTLIAIFIPAISFSQQGLVTVAEKSDFKSTSTYAEVMQFITELDMSEIVRVETMATSVEGKPVPLVVIADPLPASPEALKNDGRAVVYIQGNIHAGEVEGKEAILMYARDLLSEKSRNVLKNTVLLFCPIFNPDGNDRISKQNRTDQNGPVNGVGVRHNGQFLDINRDAMKAESPEMRGLLENVFNRWDPDLFMDCHTTNGSYHVEPVTFTWMVNPNGDSDLIRYMREKLMPSVSDALLKRHEIENCYYGEFIDMLQPEKGWILDVAGPRYLTNYYGIRNRLAILNENYVYADYKSRVRGCYYLIRSLVDYVAANSAEIKAIVDEADRRTVARGLNRSAADSFAVEYDVRPLPEKVTIKTYAAEKISDTGYPQYRKTDLRKDVTVPYYIDYYAVRSVKVPYAYIVSVPDPDILELLKAHGIRIERLVSDTEIGVEEFAFTAIKPSLRLNQGHYTNTATGKYIARNKFFPAGTYVIRMAQPLANVAAYLLEPESDDGLVLWNYFDKYLVPQWGAGFNPYPVYRIVYPVNLNTR